MFGSKNSTDECYKNERTFECCNICSCPSVFFYFCRVTQSELACDTKVNLRVEHTSYIQAIFGVLHEIHLRVLTNVRRIHVVYVQYRYYLIKTHFFLIISHTCYPRFHWKHHNSVNWRQWSDDHMWSIWLSSTNSSME